MAIVGLKGQCWLCNNFYPVDDLVPVQLPSMSLEVQHDDGRVERIGTPAATAPACRSCIAVISPLTSFRNKAMV